MNVILCSHLSFICCGFWFYDAGVILKWLSAGFCSIFVVINAERWARTDTTGCLWYITTLSAAIYLKASGHSLDKLLWQPLRLLEGSLHLIKWFDSLILYIICWCLTSYWLSLFSWWLSCFIFIFWRHVYATFHFQRAIYLLHTWYNFIHYWH